MTSTATSPPPPTTIRERSRQYSDTPRLGTSPLPRRRSSILSFESFDETKESVRSSATDFILPGLGLANHHNEPSHWHSTPLIFAILPALGGLFFTNGSAFTTDVLLLGLAAIFLNWSVRLPWEWYHSAQANRLQNSSAVIDEAPDNARPSSRASSSLKDSIESQESLHAHTGVKSEEDDELDDEQEDAARQLRVHEVMAFASTFVLPALGAYVLHVIRGQLSPRSTGLVSDYNLTIFLLAAEIRPFRQLIRVGTSRTLHLQRIVARPEGALSQSLGNNPELESRLAALEARLPPASESRNGSITQKEDLLQLSSELRKRYEPRLDALERAVRRYEKRATTLTLLTEQRLQSLETRIQDALSLAAAAAQSSQKPGKVATLLNWISKLMMIPLEAAWFVVVWPVRVAEDVLRWAAELILGPPTKPRRKTERDTKPGRSKGKRKDDIQTVPVQPGLL